MKIAFFSCLAILLCILTVTSRASEISDISENKDVHVLKHLPSAPERSNESTVADISGNTVKFELASKDVIADVEKNQRGKGANGGGSITRQPRTKSSAVMLKRPSISMSTTYVISSLPLLLLLLFVIP